MLAALSGWGGEEDRDVLLVRGGGYGYHDQKYYLVTKNKFGFLSEAIYRGHDRQCSLYFPDNRSRCVYECW